MTGYKISYQEKPETLTLNMKGDNVCEVLEQFKKANPDVIILDVEPLRTFEVYYQVTTCYATVVEAVDEAEAKRMVERGRYLTSEEYDSSDRKVSDVQEISEE